MAQQALTLRQIEVVRAVLVTGTLAGAAKVLNVSAPGLSRLIKYTEQSLDFRLFDRRQGRLVPTEQSRVVFEQINAVFRKVEDLRYIVQQMECGASQDLRIASVPSISNVMVPRAIVQLRRLHPELRMDINIVKIEEALDYLMLGKGEIVALSRRFEHPGLHFEQLATGQLICIVPDNHELAKQDSVSVRDIVRFPLIGIDPSDPYGKVITSIFVDLGLTYDMTIRARFGTTVCSLVKAGLGIAVIDQFTVANGYVPGVKVLRIEEPTSFDTWVASKAGAPLSAFATNFIRLLREEMQTAIHAPHLTTANVA